MNTGPKINLKINIISATISSFKLLYRTPTLFSEPICRMSMSYGLASLTEFIQDPHYTFCLGLHISDNLLIYFFDVIPDLSAQFPH